LPSTSGQHQVRTDDMLTEVEKSSGNSDIAQTVTNDEDITFHSLSPLPKAAPKDKGWSKERGHFDPDEYTSK